MASDNLDSDVVVDILSENSSCVNEIIVPEILLMNEVFVICMYYPKPKSPEKDNGQEEQDKRRVFIGNISPHVTEYNLLQLLKEFTITSLDYVWHTSGPYKGQPKGYAFVSFDSEETAQKVISKLNGHIIEGRHLVVAPSHNKSDSEKHQGILLSKFATRSSTFCSTKTQVGTTVKAPTSTSISGKQRHLHGSSEATEMINPKLQAVHAKHLTTERKIQALERKLNWMKQRKDETVQQDVRKNSTSSGTSHSRNVSSGSSLPRFTSRQRSGTSDNPTTPSSRRRPY